MAAAIAPDPVIVVTGAGGGIGSAICMAFASAGFNVVATYRSSAMRAAQLVASLSRTARVDATTDRKPGELPTGAPTLDHSAEHAEVTDSGSLGVLACRVAARYGRCDALVNCAGTTRYVAHNDLQALDDALIDAILSTNVRGAFAAVRAFAPLLRASPQPGGAVVVNISSIAARTATGSNVMYCASKAALENMTLSLARALAPAIRVLCVAPGLLDTDFVQSMDLRWRSEQTARTPLGRLAHPREVAAAVLCAVRDLPFTTGATISVDGGRPLG